MKNLAIFLAVLTLGGALSRADETIALSSLDLRKMSQGFGQPRANLSVDGHPLHMAGKKFDHGVGTHAYSTLDIDLKKAASRFTAFVGVDADAGNPAASVEFQVIGDGKMLWTSGVMRGNDKAKPVDVPLAGVSRLTLVVTDAGDGVAYDHADWADATFTVNGAVPVSIDPPGLEAVILTPKAPATPRINGPTIYGVRPGSPFLYTIPTTGDRPMTWAAKGLPLGLQLDAATGRITGVLKQNGKYPVTLTARNALGEATKVFRIVVGEEIALTPQMGWNSWNCWAGAVSQDKVLRSARALVSTGLIQHGWSYVNIDDAWQGRRGGPLNAIQPNEKFPDMKALCDAIHAMGLKAGIYSTPWVTTYDRHVGGSSLNPQGLWTEADSKGNVTGKKLPFALGKYFFVKEDTQQWAKWGFDYLKYDWAPVTVRETRDMSEALRASGRDIVLSLSNNGDGAVFPIVGDLSRVANSWRTTNDINDRWSWVKEIGFSQDKWAPFAGPGHWNDPDMLVIGHVGWGQPHPTKLTPNEQYTHISLWCLLSSPLLIGCDLEKLDEFTLSLLTNDEVLDVNQDALGKQATTIAKAGETCVYAKPLEDGSFAVGLFNTGPAESAVTLKWADLGIKGRQTVRDLWQQKDLGEYSDQFEVPVASQGVVLVRIIPAK